MGFTEDVPLLNSKVRIWDEELKLNDIAYVSKRTIYLDDPTKGSIEISNEEIASAISKTLDDVFEKMTQIADMVNQRNSIYERARIINENGTLPTENLVGTIDIQEHTINSPLSLWKTDDSGALIFESPDGESAFKIDGSGIQIAYDQFDGEWDWESVMDGYGIDGSYISGGYISGDLIEEGSIDFSRFDDNFRTQYYQDEREISLTAQETGKNGEILRQAGIYLSPNGIIEYAEDSELNVKSIITQSASAVQTELYATDSKLGSYIAQTATNITQYVYNTASNLSSRIEQEAGRISLVVEGTGSNAHIKPAEIVESINDSESSILLSADKIELDGNVTLSGAMGVSEGSLWIKKAVIAGSVGNYVTINNGSVNAKNLQVNSGGNLAFAGSGMGAFKTVGYSDIIKFVTGFGESSASGGQIAIPYYTVGSGSESSAGTINFNIAATQYFLDTLAKVSFPSTPRTSANFEVAAPGPVDANNAVTTIRKYFYLGESSEWDSNYKKTIDVTMKHNESGTAVTDGVVATMDVDASAVYDAAAASLELTDGYQDLTDEDITVAYNRSRDVIARVPNSDGTYTEKRAVFYGPTSWINLTSSQIYGYGFGPDNGVRVSNSAYDNGTGAVTPGTNYVWLQGTDGGWAVARSFNASDSTPSVEKPFIGNPNSGYIRAVVRVNGIEYYGDSIKLTNDKISGWGGPV